MSRPEERFLSKLDLTAPGGCWEWMGTKNDDGYGKFYLRSENGRSIMTRAHRWAYEYFIGPMPEGRVTDHLCRNRACVNPAHLEAVTNGENLRRGEGVTGYRKTHCKHGHEFTPENTYLWHGAQMCRHCQRLRQRRYMARKRQEAT